MIRFGAVCDDPSPKIIIFISEFTKMPFKANALTFVDCRVTKEILMFKVGGILVN